MSYLPVIDAAACAAHGDCAEVAPEVFRVDEIAVVTGAAPDNVMLAAAEACPSVAITLIDSETGDTVFG